MARTVQDAKIGSREARSKLPARRKPYWRQIQPGLHLGYRKPRGRRGKPAGAGMWIMRAYADGAYREKVIAAADDHADTDTVTVLNFAQAQAAVLKLAAGRDSGGPLTVAAALELHFVHLEGQGQSVVNQRYHAGAHIIPSIGDMLVAELTTKRLQKWIADLARIEPRVRTLAGRPQNYRAIDKDDAEAVRRRRSSANRIWNTLRAALTHAWEEGLVASDSTWRRVKPFWNVESARARFLSVAESQRLINGADPEFRPLLIAALQTGCRYQELARAKVADFNADAGTLAVWQSKSGKPRHVVLTDEGATFFRELCAGRSGGELMLPRADGTAWGRSHQQLKMLGACKRAKIEPAVGIHALRHTWASLAVMAGVPLMVVAKNLGHSSTRMIEKHYGHLAPSYVIDEIRARAPRFGIAKSNVASIR